MLNSRLKKIKNFRFLPPALICLLVLLANVPYLFGGFKAAPVYQQSGLQIVEQAGRLKGGSTIDPNVGFTTEALGKAAQMQIVDGSVPWWNHYEGAGVPLAGEMQSAALFPPVLLLAFQNGILFFHILLEMVAGVATYYLLRRLNCAKEIALAGGVTFGLNGTFSWLTNAPFNPIAFMPLLILGIEIAREHSRKKMSGGWLLIGIALALSLYAGFPETAYINALFAGCWATVRLIQYRKDFQGLKYYAAKLVLGATAGLLLATPIILAFANFVFKADVGGHSNSFAHASLPPISISSLFAPYIYGPIFLYSREASNQLFLFWGSVGGYLQIAALIPAVYTLAIKRDRLLKTFLLLWILLFVGRTYGAPFLADILNMVPGMRIIAVHRYSAPSFELAYIVLAMLGLRDLANAKATRFSNVVGPLFISAVIAGTAIILGMYEGHKLHLMGVPGFKKWNLLSAAGAIALMAGVLLSLLAKKPRVRQSLIALIIMLEAGIGFITPQLSAPRKVTLDYAPVSYLQHHLGQYRFFSMGPLAPNYGSYFGLASVNTNDLPVPRAWVDYVAKNLDSNVEPTIFTGTDRTSRAGPTSIDELVRNLDNYRKANVKYILAKKGDPERDKLISAGLTSVFSSSTTEVFQVDNPKTYFEVVRGNCTLSSHNRDNLQTDCKTDTTILRRELYMPGWSAVGRNRHIQVSPAGQLFQQINLRPGKTSVNFSYLPPGMVGGYIAFVAGTFLIFLGGRLESLEKIETDNFPDRL